MTSYPIGNKTSLSRKPCIPDKKLLLNSISSFGICHENVRAAPPGGGLMMTSYLVGNKTSVSQKPCIADIKLLWITIMKCWSLSNFIKKQQILMQKNYQFIK